MISNALQFATSDQDSFCKLSTVTYCTHLTYTLEDTQVQFAHWLQVKLLIARLVA